MFNPSTQRNKKKRKKKGNCFLMDLQFVNSKTNFFLRGSYVLGLIHFVLLNDYMFLFDPFSFIV